MELSEQLALLDAQERSLVLPRFAHEEAWRLGCLLRAGALARQGALAIEVRHGQTSVFVSVLSGATAENADWLRRKLAVVALFERCSLAVALQVRQRGTTLTERHGLSPRDYAAAGGAVPIRVAGTGVVGSVGVSGLPQEEDHALVCTALAELKTALEAA